MICPTFIPLTRSKNVAVWTSLVLFIPEPHLADGITAPTRTFLSFIRQFSALLSYRLLANQVTRSRAGKGEEEAKGGYLFTAQNGIATNSL